MGGVKALLGPVQRSETSAQGAQQHPGGTGMGELGTFPSPLGAVCPNGATFLPPVCVPPSCPCPPGAPQPGGGAGCHADPPQALLDVQARRALAYWFIELLQGTAGTRWDLVAGTFPYGGRGGDGAGRGQGAFAKSPLRTLLGVGGDLPCAAPSPEQHPLSPAGQRGRRVGDGGCCCPPDVATRPGPPSPAQHGVGSPPFPRRSP